MVVAALVSCGVSGGAAAAADAELLDRCLELERRALADNKAIEILRSLVAAAPKRLAGSPGMLAAEQPLAPSAFVGRRRATSARMGCAAFFRFGPLAWRWQHQPERQGAQPAEPLSLSARALRAWRACSQCRCRGGC